MSTFTIDEHNSFTAYADAEEARKGDAAGLVGFASQATLARLSVQWPLSRLVGIWNSIPGQRPVKKFQDSQQAIARKLVSWRG